MYRPGLGQEPPYGGPRAPFPGPGMQNPNQFRPPMVMQGQRGPPRQSPQFSGPYPAYLGPPGPPMRGPPPPPPPRDTQPADRLPGSPVMDQNMTMPAGSVEEAPTMPRDPEMLKNIDVTSSFVVKNGPQFEEMARKKQAGDPKFGFLFGGEPGTEAAIGRAYYEWKKNALLATFRSHSESQGPQRPLVGKSDLPSTASEAPASPDGSDMDMEDVTELQEAICLHTSSSVVPAVDLKSEIIGIPKGVDGLEHHCKDDFEEPSPGTEEQSKGLQSASTSSQPEPGLMPLSKSETGTRPQGAQDPRVPTPLSMTHPGNSPSARQTTHQPVPPVVVSERPQLDITSAELPRRKDTRRRTGFDRPCMEDVTPISSPPKQSVPPVPQDREPPSSAAQDYKDFPERNGHRAKGSRVSRWGPPDLSGPKKLPERAVSYADVSPAEIKASDQFSEDSPERDIQRSLNRQSERPEESHVEDRLEAVTPSQDDGSENEIKDHVDHLSKEKSSILVNRQSRVKLDNVRCKDSPARSHDRIARSSPPSSDDCRRRDSPSMGSDRRQRDRSPESSKHRRSVSGSDLGARAPTVDEFGRFIRQGGSESDVEDTQQHRKRRRSPSRSRSRSRSPAHSRRRRRSQSRSPRRRNRRSRSRSRSPRRKQSWSRSPPPRDLRRGGDRGYHDRGGRRGGRGERGPPPACLDHARGRCFRGSNCRFLHSENSTVSPGDGRYERGGDRGGRGGRQEDRWEGGEDGERSHGGCGSRSSWGEEALRGRRGWEHNNEKEKDYHEDMQKPLEEREREQPQTSPVSEYGDEPPAKLKENRDNRMNKTDLQVASTTAPSQLPSLLDLPPPPPPPLPQLQAPYRGNPGVSLNVSELPPPPPIPPSQPSSLTSEQQPFSMGFSQPGFSTNLPPPPPPHRGYQNLPLQPPYMGGSTQQPGYPQAQVSDGHATTLQRPTASTGLSHGSQTLAPPSRPGLAWPQTSTPPTMAYSMQVSTPQPSYVFPPPPPPPPSTAYATLSQYQFPHTLASKAGGQFDSVADGVEPGPPGAGEAGKKSGQTSNLSVSKQGMDQWKANAGGNGMSTHMGDVGMVILESVSPGLPGHHHMESVSPGPPTALVMESVSPATMVPSSKTVLSQQGTGASTFGSLGPDNSGMLALENVSPAPEGTQNWSPAVRGENNKGGASEKKSKRDKEKHDKDDHKVRGLTLLRTAVAEHVKDVLKPTWREGQMSKEAFKTIAKKAVDKVLGAIKPHQVPKTDEKVAAYMVSARPKISKLVQGYVDKYVKT